MEDIINVPYTESCGISDVYRWCSPELLDGKGRTPSSDIYAFSMTVLELMTGKKPLVHIKHTATVPFKVSLGERPLRPTDADCVRRGLDDDMWSLLQECWVKEPERRPTVDAILDRITVVNLYDEL